MLFRGIGGFLHGKVLEIVNELRTNNGLKTGANKKGEGICVEISHIVILKTQVALSLLSLGESAEVVKGGNHEEGFMFDSSYSSFSFIGG